MGSYLLRRLASMTKQAYYYAWSSNLSPKYDLHGLIAGITPIDGGGTLGLITNK